MSQPRGGYGTRKSRLCYSCSKKRVCYLFDCSRRIIVRVTGLAASPKKAPLCQECAVELFTENVIEAEIATGRLLWKSQRPTQQTAQLSLSEEL